MGLDDMRCYLMGMTQASEEHRAFYKATSMTSVHHMRPTADPDTVRMLAYRNTASGELN